MITRGVAEACTILKVVVGSHVYGLNIPSSDRDIEAIIVEPLQAAMGLQNPFEDLTIETPEEDVSYVSLRKWCRLALKGNPNFLLPLFAPASCVIGGYALGSQLREMRGCFVSRQAGRSHLGYMKNQRHRLLHNAGNGGHGPHRKDLVTKFGYDTKFAMHLLRLGMQGVEFVESGTLTLPMHPNDREFLLEVRAGKHTLDDVLRRADDLETTMKLCMDRSSMPDEPDYQQVEAWMLTVYIRSWAAARMTQDISEDMEQLKKELGA
jgi:hypothetical protein